MARFQRAHFGQICADLSSEAWDVAPSPYTESGRTSQAIQAFDPIREEMFLMLYGKRSFLWLAATLGVLSVAPSFAQPDLTYHTVTPCTLVDTRTTGGAFSPGETRTYNVAGSCGVPAWSNNIAQAQAVALNMTAISPNGPGNLKAYAADLSSTQSVVNFTTGVNVANTSPVGLAQTSGVGDIKVNATINSPGTSVHVLLMVVGYYSRDMQTVHVHPVPGDDTGSGTRLINALAGITDASATKHYVVKVEPGIYDVGSTMLTMKQYVDIEGSGQLATIIKGNSNNDSSLLTGVVKGASDAELRDLQVQSLSYSSQPISIAILLNGTTTSVRDVTTLTTGSSTWGIRILSASPTIEGVTVNSNSTGSATGIGVKFVGAAPTIKRSVIKATGITVYAIAGVYGAPKILRDVEIEATGSSIAYGYYFDPDFAPGLSTQIVNSTIKSSTYGVYVTQSSPTLVVEHSQIEAADTGIFATSGATVHVINSEVKGSASVTALAGYIAGTMLDGTTNVAACAGVYDASFTFYASTCP
jgi:hypothetical protein